MPLLARTLKETAKAELERDIRKIEEKHKVAVSQEAFEVAAAAARSNLDFAQRLSLISVEEGNDYRERIQKAGTERQEQLNIDIQAQAHSEKQIRAKDLQGVIARERGAEVAEQKQVEQRQGKDNAAPARSK